MTMKTCIVILLTVLVVSCGSGQVQEPPPSAPSPTLPSTPVPVSSTPQDPCQGHTLAWVEVPDAQAVCKKDDVFWAGSCVTSIDVTVHSCSDQDVSVPEMELHMQDEVKVQWAYDDVVIPPGQTWTRQDISGPGAGDYSMQVHLVAGEDADTWESVDFKVTNPQMTAAMQACDDCNGQWGPHGMMGMVGCLCRTTDAGTPCDDGNDCEGKCIMVEGQFQCSEFPTVFGCHSYLPPGWSEETHASPTKAPTICVD